MRKRRTPPVQIGQPLHFSHKHFFDQFCVLSAHHDLHCSDVTEHAEHPLQLSHLHFLDQILGLGAHHGLQTPGVGLGVGASVGGGVGTGVGLGVKNSKNLKLKLFPGAVV